ncbi:hypothetical protein PQJ75_24365 [Rhodoplanes sp. TEM]|uniref:Uncharacterized protein n=1 Tax=Rhodoplanes tepidamans TaxID=200616 RepID=A0ABT5JD51_RHOTP|nr:MULTISPECIES: hypothetical protein [Rhodoplanes]MDC7787599.1 hypothetical protein [Rhodoplanes tepidamans]MDC7986876.1 hypothetical protein [Rhodoplanes sp. TEM]MDQ0358027.1 hypothetical protein [Rhodoplanes tepidamans]
MPDDQLDEQEETWSRLYDRITRLLGGFGVADPLGSGDYLVVDDNYGFRSNTVEIHSLAMLRPAVVSALQAQLEDADDWEIVVTVDVPGTEGHWPPMGLIIRRDEIVDGLQRSYLPKELRDIAYEGSRPGTGHD